MGLRFSEKGYVVLALVMAIAIGCAKKEAPPPTVEEGTVVGKVVGDDGKPIPGVSVSVEAIGISTQTGADGAFKLSGLVEGVLELRFQKEGYASTTYRVSLSKGEVKDIGEIRMSVAGAIRGVVLTDEGTALGGVEVRVISAEGVEIGTFSTNDLGEFYVSGLLPGDYRIEVAKEGFDKKEESVTVEGGKVASPQITMTKIKKFVISFEPYTDEEKKYLEDHGTHSWDRMVQDFGQGFLNNHFRFADGSAYWIYKFTFPTNRVRAVAKLDLGAEFKVSVSNDELNYTVELEEREHIHALQNKKVYEINLDKYFGPTNKTKAIWIKFEDNIPSDGWGPYLDSFTLEYELY
jgi:hypothetical protein